VFVVVGKAALWHREIRRYTGWQEVNTDVTIRNGRSSLPSRSGTARATNRFIWLGTLSLSPDLRRSSYSQPVNVASRPRTSAISVKWTSLPHIDLHCGQLIRTGDVDQPQGKLRDQNTGSLIEEVCIDQQDRLTQRQTKKDGIGWQ
jgi:hypothetical protein